MGDCRSPGGKCVCSGCLNYDLPEAPYIECQWPLTPGWLHREIEAAERELLAWPVWKRRGLELPEAKDG